ncbi:hypothetical protein FE772_00150 [Lysobacter enzymogenes]|nr:hypothetical protein FE772_00150 [Lysobacter enzymogenes]
MRARQERQRTGRRAGLPRARGPRPRALPRRGRRTGDDRGPGRIAALGPSLPGLRAAGAERVRRRARSDEDARRHCPP